MHEPGYWAAMSPGQCGTARGPGECGRCAQPRRHRPLPRLDGPKRGAHVDDRGGRRGDLPRPRRRQRWWHNVREAFESVQWKYLDSGRMATWSRQAASGGEARGRRARTDGVAGHDHATRKRRVVGILSERAWGPRSRWAALQSRAGARAPKLSLLAVLRRACRRRRHSCMAGRAQRTPPRSRRRASTGAGGRLDRPRAAR
jgi:hypothetical protein